MIPTIDVPATASVAGQTEQRIIQRKFVPLSIDEHHANLAEILNLKFGEVKDAFVTTERGRKSYHLELKSEPPVEVIVEEKPIYHVGTRKTLGYRKTSEGVLQELAENWGISHDPSIMPKDIPTKDLGEQTREACKYGKALYDKFYRLHTPPLKRILNFIFRR
jgi:hypothetical protein